MTRGALILVLLLTGCGPALTYNHKIVCLGDSETFGLGLPRGEDYPSQLQVALGGDWVVANAGVSGNTTRDMLARFQADVASQVPGYVIIMGGENDIYYGYDVTSEDASYHNDSPTGPEANVLAMINASWVIGATPVVATMLPHGGIDTVPDRAKAMLDLISWELRLNLGVIDFYSLLLDGSRPGYPIPALTRDNLHPSAAGAAVMATYAAKFFTLQK